MLDEKDLQAIQTMVETVVDTRAAQTEKLMDDRFLQTEKLIESGAIQTEKMIKDLRKEVDELKQKIA